VVSNKGGRKRVVTGAVSTLPGGLALGAFALGENVITIEDLDIPAAAQRFMAARAHAHTTEVAGSHSVAVSHPDLVADVIERAARATAR
jgi:hypothetical protein